MEDKTGKGMKPAAVKSKARLSGEAWAKIKAEYLTGMDTVKDIAARFGITDRAIFKRAEKEAWGERGSFKKELTAAATAKAVDELVDKHKQAIIEANDIDIEKINLFRDGLETVFRYNVWIAKNKMNELPKDEEGRPIFTPNIELNEVSRTIGYLSRQFKTLVGASSREILGLSDKSIFGEKEKESGFAAMEDAIQKSFDDLVKEKMEEAKKKEGVKEEKPLPVKAEPDTAGAELTAIDIKVDAIEPKKITLGKRGDIDDDSDFIGEDEDYIGV